MSDLDLDNHRSKYCFDSKYADREYLQFVSLQQKFVKLPEVRQSYQDALDLEKTRQQSRDIDDEFDRLDHKDKEDFSQVNKLLRKWQSNKEVLGVKDSDIEARSQRLFGLLDNDSNRRKLYISDMEMFKKKHDDTKAITSTNVARIREIEDIIVQRDSSINIY